MADIILLIMENSRFKYFLVPEGRLSLEAGELRSDLKEIFQAYDRKTVSAPQMLFLVIATVCERRKPGEWWMKGSSRLAFSKYDTSEKFGVLAQKLRLPTTVLSVQDFFSRYRLKNLPHAIARVLWLWSEGRAQLHLCEEPITPQKMLSMQAQGARVVTCARASFLEGRQVDGKRDGLEFLLHDLTHADLFFSETHEEQKDFFSNLQAALEQQAVANVDPTFQTALEYIMSDMNSTRAHLQSSLKAVVIDHERRQQKMTAQDVLSARTEQELAQRWGRAWDSSLP